MDTKAVGERIQIAREERCMTQRGLAEAVGCTPQHISAIERGAKTPTLETFVAIAAALRAFLLNLSQLPSESETSMPNMPRLHAHTQSEPPNVPVNSYHWIAPVVRAKAFPSTSQGHDISASK